MGEPAAAEPPAHGGGARAVGRQEGLGEAGVLRHAAPLAVLDQGRQAGQAGTLREQEVAHLTLPLLLVHHVVPYATQVAGRAGKEKRKPDIR